MQQQDGRIFFLNGATAVLVDGLGLGLGATTSRAVGLLEILHWFWVATGFWRPWSSSFVVFCRICRLFVVGVSEGQRERVEAVSCGQTVKE